MSTATPVNWLEMIEPLPGGSVLTLHNIAWDDYEDLLDQVGEAAGLRISYDEGTVQIMTLSTEHEKYVRFIEQMVGAIRLRMKINILFFGSATMRKRRKKKGNEPDACFYVQHADQIGNRIHLDFAVDPPPDVAVEVDIHHGSLSKFPIYAALEVPELWHYDGQELVMYLLVEESYVKTSQSHALPILTANALTDFLKQMRDEGEFKAILAFDQWLPSQS